MIKNKDYKFPVSLSRESFPDKVISDAMIGSASEENKKIRKAYGYRKNATIHYERIELTSEDLLMCLSEGHVVCQLFKDGEKNIPFKAFTKAQKKNVNFEGAYVIFVDIDKTCFNSVSEFVKILSLQPTFYYTTYSNLQKDKGLRFRLAYVFDKMIVDNPYSYKYVAHKINDIIENDTLECVDDKCNERCSQYFNGTNKKDKKINYESGITNIIYSIDDLCQDGEDIFGEGYKEFLINYCEYSSYNVDHINLIGKLLKQYTNKDYVFNTSEKRFVLASDGFSDDQMYNMSDFYYKCSDSLKFAIRECGFKGYDTFMKYNRHTYNYIYRKEYDTWIDDEYRIPDDDYFVLPFITKKIKDHQHRRINLYERTCLRRVLCPTANANTLLFCMYEDICKFFDYSDGVLNLTFMVRNVENAMKQPIEIIKEKYKDKIEELKKRNPDIVLKKGVAHGSPEHKRKVRIIKLRIVKELYDVTKNVEQNRIMIMEKTGLDFKERTLYRMKKEIGLPNSKEKCNFDLLPNTKENVKTEVLPNTKEKCYSTENQEDTEVLPNTKEKCYFEETAKLNSIVYSYSSVGDDSVNLEGDLKDNNEIKDKDKEDMNTDIEEKYRWMLEVTDRIEHDDVIQKYRKINLEKKQNITDSSSAQLSA